MTRGARADLFGGPPPLPSGPAPCAWEGCGKLLHRGGINGMHAACARKAGVAADLSVEIYKRLAAHWSSEFQRIRGEPPLWCGKDMAAIKGAALKLVPEIGEERVRAMITVCLETGRSISFMVSEPNYFIGKRPSRYAAGTHRTLQQRPTRG